MAEQKKAKLPMKKNPYFEHAINNTTENLKQAGACTNYIIKMLTQGSTFSTILQYSERHLGYEIDKDVLITLFDLLDDDDLDNTFLAKVSILDDINILYTDNINKVIIKRDVYAETIANTFLNKRAPKIAFKICLMHLKDFISTIARRLVTLIISFFK